MPFRDARSREWMFRNKAAQALRIEDKAGAPMHTDRAEKVHFQGGRSKRLALRRRRA
jgi:uncharacterized protein (DUF1684 family)